MERLGNESSVSLRFVGRGPGVAEINNSVQSQEDCIEKLLEMLEDSQENIGVRFVEGLRRSKGTPESAVGVSLELGEVEAEDEEKKMQRVPSGIESMTLHRIHDLMSKAECKLNEEKELKMQQNAGGQSPQLQRKFDFEFERLLLQLRNEYQQLFDNKN